MRKLTIQKNMADTRVKKADIFISYRREGGEDAAVQIRDALREIGYDVFLDFDSLRVGAFDEQLYYVIDNCKDFILILPPNGLDRCVNPDDWVRKEVERAREKGKNIIPVRLKNFHFPEEVPESLEFLRKQQSLAPSAQYFSSFIHDKMVSLLSSRPKPKAKPWMIIAVVLVLLELVYGLYTKFSKYPHNKQQEQLVSQVVTYMVLNMQNYDSANAYFLSGIDEAEKYINGKSKLEKDGVEEWLTSQSIKIAAIPVNEFANKEGLVNSPFPVSEIEGFAAYLQSSYDFLCGQLDEVKKWIDIGWNDENYLKYLDLLREYAELDLEVLFYGMNRTLLPVTNESALKELKTVYLPKLNSMRKLTFLNDADAVDGKIEAAASRQEQIFTKDLVQVYDDLEKSIDAADDETKLQNILILKEYFAGDSERLENLNRMEETLRGNIEKKKELERAKTELEHSQAELDAAKNELYIKYKPYKTDDQDMLWTKGSMFLLYNMNEAARECFDLYAKQGDPADELCGNAAMKFAEYRSELAAEGGIIIFGYEDGFEKQDVAIGDIIYAVDGVLIHNNAEYTSARSDGKEHTISILRFYETGYEQLTATYDPQKGRLLNRSMLYENVQKNTD